jgi:hypothetical protein
MCQVRAGGAEEGRGCNLWRGCSDSEEIDASRAGMPPCSACAVMAGDPGAGSQPGRGLILIRRQYAAVWCFRREAEYYSRAQQGRNPGVTRCSASWPPKTDWCTRRPCWRWGPSPTPAVASPPCTFSSSLACSKWGCRTTQSGRWVGGSTCLHRTALLTSRGSSARQCPSPHSLASCRTPYCS